MAEMLVGVALFSLILIALLTFYFQVIRVNTLSEELAMSVTEATRLLQFLRNDVKRLHMDGKVTLADAVTSPSSLEFSVSSETGICRVHYRTAQGTVVREAIHPGREEPERHVFGMPRMREFTVEYREDTLETPLRNYRRGLYTVRFLIDRDPDMKRRTGVSDLPLQFATIIAPDTALFNWNRQD